MSTKKMSFFKRVFGKHNWITIYTCKCNVWRTTLGMFPHQVSARVVVKLERERNLVKCYVTDGDIKQTLELSYVIAECPGVIQPLEYYKIPIDDIYNEAKEKFGETLNKLSK